MTYNTKTKSLVALSALLFSTQVTAYAKIKLYTDGQCQEPVEGARWGSSAGLDNELKYLEITNGVRDFQDFSNPIVDPTFPGTNSTGAGSVVYFDVPQPDHTCAYIIMTDYKANKYYGDNPLPGMALIWAAQAGCYYSEIPAHASLFTTYCCGSGDCSTVDLGQTSILPNKRELSATTSQENKFNDDKSKDDKPRSASSLTGLAAAAAAAKLEARDGKHTCKLYNKDGSPYTATTSNQYTKAGKQQAVSSIEKCVTSSDCVLSEAGSVDTSTTMSTSSSTSVGFDAGMSVGIEAGTNFIVEATVSAEFSLAITKSWETATGKDVSNGTSQTVTHQLGIVEGQDAFLTFTPTYICHEAYMACDGQEMSSQPIEYCTLPNDESINVNGIFSTVYC